MYYTTMQIDRCFTSPLSAYAYLERFVNDGSPSGFTFEGGVSTPCHPISPSEFFELPIFSIPFEKVTAFGDLRNLPWAAGIVATGGMPVPVHPDVLPSIMEHGSLSKATREYLAVSPTASQRTVLATCPVGGTPFFIKLHYPAVIGRFRRSIPLYKWVAALESSHFMRASSAGMGKSVLSFLEEFAGVYLEPYNHVDGFGTIFRSFPVECCDGNDCLIPAFSLFSKDARSPDDPVLLIQLIRAFHLTVEEFLEHFVAQLINGYVALVTRVGLLPECNAQNVLYHVNSEGRVTNIYIRDMEDLWKDLPLREQLALDTACVEYHTIRAIQIAITFNEGAFCTTSSWANISLLLYFVWQLQPSRSQK